MAMPDVARFCLRLVTDRANAGRLTLKTDVPADLPPLLADSRAIKQILINLLSNSVKFTPAGGEIRISVPDIDRIVRIYTRNWEHFQTEGNSPWIGLIYGGQVEGVVEVISTGPLPGLSRSDLDLFRDILNVASGALQTIRLYELQRSTAERLAEVDKLKSQFLRHVAYLLYVLVIVRFCGLDLPNEYAGRFARDMQLPMREFLLGLLVRLVQARGLV